MSKHLNVLDDQIYGESTVELPVMIDLIASTPFQRLKGINQFGVPGEFYHLSGFSRYEHSIGVTLLLRHLGATEEEQVAGLLHDVSHKAFSHIYDWVVGTAGDESSQDDGHDSFIRNSEISAILQRHGYSVDRITDYHHFGLLERDAPALCADRVDYVLREVDITLARQLFEGLTVFDSQIVCKNQESAALFGRVFLARQTNHWGAHEGVVRYHVFSNMLKYALKKRIIEKDDFLQDDDYIVDKLKFSDDSHVMEILEYLRQKQLPKATEGITVHKKFRYIDPPFISGEGVKRLTEVDKEFRELLDNARRVSKKGIVVPV